MIVLPDIVPDLALSLRATVYLRSYLARWLCDMFQCWVEPIQCFLILSNLEIAGIMGDGSVHDGACTSADTGRGTDRHDRG